MRDARPRAGRQVPSRVVETLSASEARRVAIAAQGFTGRRPARPGRASVEGMAMRLGVLQIDSVSALVRSHYLPVFSRLGAYDRRHVDDAAYRRRVLFEYWGHEASYLPTEVQPLLRWRMARRERLVAEPPSSADDGLVRIARDRPEYVRAVLAEVEAHGPLAAGDLSAPGAGRGPWWGWADGKTALEYLFATGRVAVADRRGFARLYDLTERVLPPDVLAMPTPPEDEARRALVARSAAALGVATVGDLADYYRLKVTPTRAAVRDLVEEGVLRPVRVEGWGEPAYLHARATVPARVTSRALLSMFDSLVWDRRRTERMFGFRYRIEIYTPEHLRVHGYYVLPFLMGDRIPARVDLRADRRTGVLSVPGAFTEPGARPDRVAEALAAEVRRLAGWLGLDEVRVGERGDLAPVLAAALG